MDEEISFEKYMTQMGVKPLKNPGPVQRLASPQDPDNPAAEPCDDTALFLQALETIPEHGLQKDRAQDPSRHRFHKLKPGEAPTQAPLLDLHGMKREEALTALARFVAHAFTHKRKSVIVITGKGLHSKDGRSVLKPQVEAWILKQGRHYLRAYSEAPRAYGGRGAFILYLHPPG